MTWFDGERRLADDDPHTCSAEKDTARLQEEMRREIQEEKARRSRIDAQWSALGDLPQLFIAV